MKDSLPLPEDIKLSVVYRIEAGCLGPEGVSHISSFCAFAQKELRALNSSYVNWNIEPRSNKALPEMQYSAIGKGMSHSQADKYLAIFDKSLDEFEIDLGQQMAGLIDRFFDR